MLSSRSTKERRERITTIKGIKKISPKSIEVTKHVFMQMLKNPTNSKYQIVFPFGSVDIV